MPPHIGKKGCCRIERHKIPGGAGKGFGEIFRAISYEELGAGSLLSRATAGIYRKTMIFAMPGSPNAVKTGLGIIIDELGHLKKHATK